MSAPTNADWGHIYKKAWLDAKFRYLLETDPTKALKEYGAEVGKTFDKMVEIEPAPDSKEVPEKFWHLLHQAPPACC